MDEKDNQSEIMKCLGTIIGRLDSMDRNQSRVTYALIGIIAAQIGVKVLGTDPLLDIATVLALFGCVMILGCLITGIRVIRNGRRKMTRSGLWLAIVVGFIIIVQMAVYLRELGILSVRAIYIIRIFQNFAIVMLAWNLMRSAEIFSKPKDNEPCDPKISKG